MKRNSKVSDDISIQGFHTHPRPMSRCFSQLCGIMTPAAVDFPILSLHDPSRPIPGTIKHKSFLNCYDVFELPKLNDKEGVKPPAPSAREAAIGGVKPERGTKEELGVVDVNLMGCRDKITHKRWAVRRLVKQKKNVHKPEDLHLLLSISHPNILGIREIFETKELFYIVTELAEGLEIIDSILAGDYYTEFQAIDNITQILSGLDYLHDRGIAHMKLQPSNILLIGWESDARVVLADFATSSLIGNNVLSKCFTSCLGFCAPEVLRSTQPSIAADIWSVGVLAYTILSGDEPFFSVDVSDVYKRILKADVTYCTKSWDIISFNAKDLVKSMLVKEPDARPRAYDLLKHKWFTGKASRNVNLYETIRNLRAYQDRHGKCRWRAEQFGRVRMMGDEFKAPIKDPFEFSDKHEPEDRTDAEQGELDSQSVDQERFLIELLSFKKE